MDLKWRKQMRGHLSASGITLPESQWVNCLSTRISAVFLQDSCKQLFNRISVRIWVTVCPRIEVWEFDTKRLTFRQVCILQKQDTNLRGWKNETDNLKQMMLVKKNTKTRDSSARSFMSCFQVSKVSLLVYHFRFLYFFSVVSRKQDDNRDCQVERKTRRRTIARWWSWCNCSFLRFSC